MPQLDAIGIVSADQPRSIAFYRLLGIKFAEGEGHIEAWACCSRGPSSLASTCSARRVRRLSTTICSTGAPRRRALRPLRLSLIGERLPRTDRELTLLRPPSADDLIDEQAFGEDEFMPYWAELWPSGVALARIVSELDLTGMRALALAAPAKMSEVSGGG